MATLPEPDTTTRLPAKLVPLARVLIILTMFTGRVGPMTLALIFARRQNRTKALLHYPEEHIMIG